MRYIDVTGKTEAEAIENALRELGLERDDVSVEILERGKVPFYCCAWSNLASARNAIKSGFRPAWVQVTAKPTEFVNQMNGEATVCGEKTGK